MKYSGSEFCFPDRAFLGAVRRREELLATQITELFNV
jgi:hypothetical protein